MPNLTNVPQSATILYHTKAHAKQQADPASTPVPGMIPCMGHIHHTFMRTYLSRQHFTHACMTSSLCYHNVMPSQSAQVIHNLVSCDVRQLCLLIVRQSCRSKRVLRPGDKRQQRINTRRFLIVYKRRRFIVAFLVLNCNV